MCARRFLITVFVLTLLVVAGAFAIFQWGGNVLLKQATPKGHFEAAEAGAGGNYASDDAWLTRPGIDWPDNPVEWKPAGDAPPQSGPRRAAVFYVHPTTYFERDRWNAPLRLDGAYTDLRTRLFLQSQASAFNDVGEIWAPRYRQAAYGAFLLANKDARAALDLAFRDVADAFDEFVRQSGNRPIILAGHSQGALHLERLLLEKVAGKPVAGRIVAAYVVGWPVSITADLPALGLPACRTADEAGCILSWMSFGQPANADLVLSSYKGSRGFAGSKRRREDMLCVNPLTGRLNGAAGPEANLGTLVPAANMLSATLQPERVGARCDKGLLILDGDIPAMGPYVLPGNNYHVYDFALFWENIAQDATVRLNLWEERG